MSAEHAAHGGPSDEGMTQNQKSVGLAVFVIVALLATIYYFVELGEKRHAAHGPIGAEAQASQHAGAPGVKSEIRRPARQVFPAGSVGNRARFAAGLERRMQRRGNPLTAKATGPDNTIFQISFPAETGNERHIRDLQRAEALFRQTRGIGFKKFTIRVGDREVFGRDL